ncbi:MAG: response regulator [Bacteroidales bacterium]|nr:MAG: response regulator [Paludibacter sp.]MCE1156901.1 response regulator [Bacteroidales bacterium]OJX88319.1 MAG: hypothetical protein BGP01_09900 [Paludibacter sp. 47-17]
MHIDHTKPAYTVLIAEDEDINYMILELLFKNVATVSYSIHRAVNGKVAVDFCASHPVDLVLMDIKMPVMDGYEATRLIKSNHPELPVIVQTAYATDADRRKAFEYGCDDFFTKPIQKEQLSLMLKTYLQ